MWLTRVGIEDVQDVRSGAVVDLAVAQDERLGVASARSQKPRARSAPKRLFHGASREADPASVHRAAGGLVERQRRLVPDLDADVAEQLERGIVEPATLLLAPEYECGPRHA